MPDELRHRPLRVAVLASCAACQLAPSPAGRPGQPAAPLASPSDRIDDGRQIRTPRWPRAGKPAMCEVRLAATSGDLHRAVERAIDRRAIRDCHRQYLRTARPDAVKEGPVELSFTVGEDGRIVVPHARSIDYMLDACIERAVEDTCVGMIVDEYGQPHAVPFTIDMYLSRT